MRPALVSLAGRRPLCAACAACVHGGHPATVRTRHLSAAAATIRRRSASSMAMSLPVPIRVRCRNMPATQRSLSQTARQSQPQPQRIDENDKTESKESKEGKEGTSAEKSLPFYALFPNALPLGPPPQGPFVLDVRALRAEFLRLQATSHPDFYHDSAAGGNSAEGTAARARAEAASAYINEAYRTLASPLLRAQYLLRERFGVDLAADESTLLGKAAGADRDLLLAVLDAREEIEAATAETDLAPLRTTNDVRIRESEAALAEAFAADDGAAAQHEAIRLRYWTNIDEALRNWEPGKEIVLEH